MSGYEESELKSSLPRFRYVPLALEIFLAFIPFLILFGVYLGRLLGELTTYDTDLKWITMTRLVKKEAFLLEEQMKDGKLEAIDLQTKYQEIVLPDHDLEGPASPFMGFRQEDIEWGLNNILIQYLFYDKEGRLLALDASNGELAVIPEETQFYEYAAYALKANSSPESYMRTVYRLDGQDYYGSFITLQPVKPVYCDDLLLSDGSDGSRILIGGQLSCSMSPRTRYYSIRMIIVYIFAYILLVGVVCFCVFWTLRGLYKIIHVMEAVCRGDTNLPDFDADQLREQGAPEIRELIENFHLMFLSIQKYQKSVSSIRELYEPLLPAAFLALFPREDIREIRPGDKTAVEGRILSVRLISSDNSTRALLRERNALIREILEIVTSVKMIVTELEYDRITVLCLQREMGVEKEIETIRALDGTGTGVDEILVTETEGVFCFTVTGAPEHMAIRMEQIPEEVPEKCEE